MKTLTNAHRGYLVFGIYNEGKGGHVGLTPVTGIDDPNHPFQKYFGVKHKLDADGKPIIHISNDETDARKRVLNDMVNVIHDRISSGTAIYAGNIIVDEIYVETKKIYEGESPRHYSGRNGRRAVTSTLRRARAN